jgi:hypothetical protein
MLSDLAALTPPLLVAVAFLIAAGAFLRHEMRRGKSTDANQARGDSRPDSAAAARENEVDQGSVSRSPDERGDDPDPPSGV